MANDSTSTPLLWVLDTVGFLYTGVVYLSKIVFIPNAASDDVLFNTWDENTANLVADGYRSLITGTITSTDTLTVAGTNLPAAIADGYIFNVTASTGTALNLGRRVVKTAGTNTAVVIHNDEWTDEGPFVYTWETYKATTAIVLKAGATDASPIQIDFGPKARRIENLSLETLTGGTLYVYHARAVNI